MLEPVTLSLIAQSLATSQLVSSVIGGWLGNRSDHYLCKAGQVVYEHLKNQSEPVNHDIQRAVRDAYLQATLMACEKLLYQKYNWIDRRFHLPTYDLKEIIGYLKNQRRQLGKAKFIKQTNPADADYLLLLEPSGRPAYERINELKQQLRDNLLRELADANLCVEDDLRAAILTGWTDEDKPVDWYELMCAFFAESLKTNARLSTIIQTNLLLELKTRVPEVQWPDNLLEQQAALIGEAVQPLVDRFEAVMTRLDEMLAILGEVRDGVTDANDKLDILINRPVQQFTRSKYLNAFAQYDLANFIERKPLSDAIAAHFLNHRLLLLRGMGGIGKTTLAKAYISQASEQYDHIAYVEIVGTIADSILHTLGSSPDVVFTSNSDKSNEENFTSLLDVLRHIPKLLLVLDNALDPDDLGKRKQALESLNATVLITGRVKLRAFEQARLVQEISYLAPEEAMALFENRSGMPVPDTDRDDVKAMLAQAYHHPKLIEVIARALYANPLLDLAKVRAIVAERAFDAQPINVPFETGEPDQPTATVYKILRALFDTEPLTDDLRQLLRYFAVLPAIDIPVADLIQLLGYESPEEQQPLIENLRALAQTGWLDDLHNRYFSMHGLVQWVVLDRLNPTPGNCATLLHGTTRMFYQLIAKNPLDTQPYLMYGDELLRTLVDDHNDSIATLLSNLAASYNALGNNQKALKYDLRALTIRENTLDQNHPDLAIPYANIAVTYGYLGDNQKALEYDLIALNIRENTLDQDQLELAHSYANIGVTYGKLGGYQKALVYSFKALNIRENKLHKNHPLLSTSYGNISTTYWALGDNQKALEYGLKALTIRENILDQNHPNLARSYANIAVTYGELGDNQKALEYGLKALTIRENILDQNHPDLATSYGNIAVTYGSLNNIQKRLEYDQKALTIRKNTLNQNHPDLAISYYNVATTHYFIGDLLAALSHMQKAVVIQEYALPPTHPNLINSKQSLAFLEKAFRNQNNTGE